MSETTRLCPLVASYLPAPSWPGRRREANSGGADGFHVPRWLRALPAAAGSGKGASATWDYEPVDLMSDFEVKLEVFDSTGVLLQSKSQIVTTPK